jgi:hypothetical protein
LLDRSAGGSESIARRIDRAPNRSRRASESIAARLRVDREMSTHPSGETILLMLVHHESLGAWIARADVARLACVSPIVRSLINERVVWRTLRLSDFRGPDQQNQNTFRIMRAVEAACAPFLRGADAFERMHMVVDCPVICSAMLDEFGSLQEKAAGSVRFSGDAVRRVLIGRVQLLGPGETPSAKVTLTQPEYYVCRGFSPSLCAFDADHEYVLKHVASYFQNAALVIKGLVRLYEDEPSPVEPVPADCSTMCPELWPDVVRALDATLIRLRIRRVRLGEYRDVRWSEFPPASYDLWSRHWNDSDSSEEQLDDEHDGGHETRLFNHTWNEWEMGVHQNAREVPGDDDA